MLVCAASLLPAAATENKNPEQPQKQVQHTLAIDVQGQGSTNPDVGVHVYSQGEIVTVCATPAEHWQFIAWLGDVEEIADPTTPCITLLMDRNRMITAVFECEPRFLEDNYEFTIERDYNQARAVSLTNACELPAEVWVELAGPPPEDLLAGFTGTGSQDTDPVTLEPGDTLDVRLMIHAADALQPAYMLTGRLHTVVEEQERIFDSPITVQINPPSLDFSFTEIEVEDCTQVRHLELANSGGAINDLRIHAGPGLSDILVFDPHITHGRVPAGTGVSVRAIPDLAALLNDPAHPRSGTIYATAGAGTAAERTEAISVDFTCGAGEGLYAATLRNQMVTAEMQDWYCTNRPIIESHFYLPSGFTAADIGKANLAAEFTPRSGWVHQPHTVRILLNGTEVAVLEETIPRGPYEFELPVSALALSASGTAANTLRLEMMGNSPGHYVVATNFHVAIALDEAALAVCANDQDAAAECANYHGYFQPQPASWAITDVSIRTTTGIPINLERCGDVELGVSYLIEAETEETELPLYVVARPNNGGPAVRMHWLRPGRYRGIWTPRHGGELPQEVDINLFTGACHNGARTACVTLNDGGLAPGFEAEPRVGQAPLPVQFTDLTPNPDLTEWTWSFGDEATATEQNPVHIYTEPGAYPVSLTVKRGTSTATAAQNAYIFVDTEPEPVLQAPESLDPQEGAGCLASFEIQNSGTGPAEYRAVVVAGGSWLRIVSDAAGTLSPGLAEDPLTATRVVLLIEPNNTFEERVGRVRIEAAGAESSEVMVPQNLWPASLLCTVRDADTSAPLANAALQATPVQPAANLNGVTDLSGEYRWEPVAPGLYNIMASLSGYYTYQTSEPVQVFPGAMQQVVIQLEAMPGSVYGVIRDDNDNTFVQGATVTLDPGSYQAATATDGAYEITGVPGGLYTARVAAPGYDDLYREIVVEPGMEARQDFRLTSDFVPDDIPPTIIPNGDSFMTVECGVPFSDPGATATDERDGDITDRIITIGGVDEFTPGMYTVTYRVNDNAGNIDTATRTVTVVDTTPPTITLLGGTAITMECGSPFVDPGASANDTCAGDLSGSVRITGAVPANTPGTHTLTYAAEDGAGNRATATRTVTVVDHSAPSLNLLGSETVALAVGEVFAEPGFTATDACEGDLTARVVVTGDLDVNTTGTYTLQYSVTDAAGHTDTETRTVVVGDGTLDETPPVITLNGANPMTVECGQPFDDPGATATDNIDGDLTGAIEAGGGVDEDEPGSYTREYSVTDTAGNTATASRTVTVEDTRPPTITLNHFGITGGPTAQVEVGASYTDPGASAIDQCDGVVSVARDTSGVDTTRDGTCTVEYTAEDAAGNTATKSRTVIVGDGGEPEGEIEGEEPGPDEEPGCGCFGGEKGKALFDRYWGDLLTLLFGAMALLLAERYLRRP